jgi:hypothetical protein
MQDAHTLYMDFNINLVFIQIKFKKIIKRYLYIYEGKINLQKCGMENSWMSYAWYKMCIS